MAKKTTKKSTKKPDISQKLITAAFELALTTGWRSLGMKDIAIQAKVPLPDALKIYASKDALLDAVMDQVDQLALAEAKNFQDQDTVKDKLFALLMARFDALSPNREAIACIVRDTLCNPLRNPGMIMCRLPRILQSMALMLETVNIDSRGLMGLVKTKALGLIFANALRVWLHDQTDDLGPTMLTLYKGFRPADRLAQIRPFHNPLCKSLRKSLRKPLCGAK